MGYLWSNRHQIIRSCHQQYELFQMMKLEENKFRSYDLTGFYAVFRLYLIIATLRFRVNGLPRIVENSMTELFPTLVS